MKRFLLLLALLLSMPQAFAQTEFLFTPDDVVSDVPAPTPVSAPTPTPTPPPQVKPKIEPAPPARDLILLPPRQVQTENDATSTTEAAVTSDCPSCTALDKNIRDLQAVVRGAMKTGNLSSWKRSRGLVQLPTRGERGNIGPCGSFHYSPDKNKKGQVTDNYANPLTACVFMSVLQDWKKRCPDSQSGCRVAWGDISHETSRSFNGHRTHTDGHCIDIRPMRRGKFDNAPLNYPQSDRATTAEFIRLLKAKGGSSIYYNDPQAKAQPMGGHSNHLHVCFKPDKKTKDVCSNYKYDASVCGSN